MPDNMLHGLCVFLSRFRATPSYGATKPCLSSWLQPCISSWTSSRRLPTAHKPSVPTWSVPSWDDEPCCGATSRCDAVWSSRTSSLPCSTWWIPNGAPCSWPPRPVSTLSERSQRSSSSWRHRWTFSWRNSRDGNGDGGTQSPQEDEEEDEESTQAWAPQTRQVLQQQQQQQRLRLSQCRLHRDDISLNFGLKMNHKHTQKKKSFHFHPHSEKTAVLSFLVGCTSNTRSL